MKKLFLNSLEKRNFTKDLFTRGLMSTDSLGGMMSENGIFASRTTDMGKKFLQFITSPIKEEIKVE